MLCYIIFLFSDNAALTLQDDNSESSSIQRDFVTRESESTRSKPLLRPDWTRSTFVSPLWIDISTHCTWE